MKKLPAHCFLVATLVVWLFVGPVSSRAAQINFSQDIRPILSENCFKCHGPDDAARKSKLRLDRRDAALQPAKSGKRAIVPGKPTESELISRITTDNTDDVMPPSSTQKKLTTKQRELLRMWIAAGAEYQEHWAFVPPKRSALPKVKQKNWPINEIDNFVLARLEKEGLEPSPQADRYTLARRVYLDLIGLPPDPARVDAFVNDKSPDAYEKLVDELLASNHYGERWARRWLDLARYADTNGYEKDRPRSMWPYRDWVINALNADMPFDKFTVEQIAGDMLPNATPDQIIATGFHRNTMLNEEGGIDPQEYRFYSMVDRVHVTATTWLGLTMACAQCHTHKYDPIKHSEYYQFMALLNNADEPTYSVPKPELVAKRKSLQEKIGVLEAALVDKFPAEVNVEWLTPGSAEFSSKNGSEAELLIDGSFRVSGKNPDKETYTVKFDTSLRRITHVQLEAIPDENVGKGGPGRTDHGNFVLSEIEMEISGHDNKGEPRKLKFAQAEADFSQDSYPVSNAIDGKIDAGGWAISGNNILTHRRAVFTLAEPLVLEKDSTVTVRLIQEYGSQHTLGRFRLSIGNALSSSISAENAIGNRDRKFAKWMEKELTSVVKWQRLRPTEATSNVPVLTIQNDDSVFALGDFTKSDTYKLKFRNLPADVRAIRLEALPDDRLPKHGPGIISYEGPEGDFYLSNIKVLVGTKSVSLKNPTESLASGGNNAAKAIDGDLQSGWSINGGQGRAQNAIFQLAEPLGKVDELQIELSFEQYYAAALGRFRISVTTEENAKASTLPEEVYNTLVKYRSDGGVKSLLTSNEAAADRDILLRQFVKVSPMLANERRAIEQLRAEMPELPSTLVMRERPQGFIRATHRYDRGEFLNPKELVEPGIPEVLPQLAKDAPRNRLGLAQWLVSPQNPLTARVIMNRHWEAFFGRGLVHTTENFGFQGEPPSHPELLDWLALEFVKQGWSQKKVFKLIVMSATYQQSSRVTPQMMERDPQNVLLARGARSRIEAELVRDYALTASGLFSGKVGGPSVYPPQPAGVSTDGSFGALEWKTSEGPDRYRRGLYIFSKRTAPYAMTMTFDGPSGEACLARRDRSNTPLQALTLLNDEVFMECAQALGKSAVEQGGEVNANIERVFRRCLVRPPTDSERKKLAGFYESQLDRFAKGELKAEEIAGKNKSKQLNEQAAWTMVARAVLNLDETITKN
ncbi:MAG: Planctomycete cytochrome [Pedosphaera sp.]|nr:Planctomycete cytochrome [Pedosphaera sp.]